MSHPPKSAPCLHSLSDNNLTNYSQDMSSLLKLVEVLPQTKIESLRCGPAQMCFVSAHIDTSALAILAHPLTRSLRGNNIGFEGASALAAVVKQTKIITLECAAARAFAFCVSAR